MDDSTINNVIHTKQVFDLTRLRDMTPVTPVPELEADAHYAGFGNCHNIAANPELEKVYGIGATRSGDGYEICGGGKSSSTLKISFIGFIMGCDCCRVCRRNISI